jgi:hypothetical protein
VAWFRACLVAQGKEAPQVPKIQVKGCRPDKSNASDPTRHAVHNSARARVKGVSRANRFGYSRSFLKRSHPANQNSVNSTRLAPLSTLGLNKQIEEQNVDLISYVAQVVLNLFHGLRLLAQHLPSFLLPLQPWLPSQKPLLNHNRHSLHGPCN